MYLNLGYLYTQKKEYHLAIAYSEADYEISKPLGIEHSQARAAMGVGLALVLLIKADRQKAVAAGSPPSPRPPPGTPVLDVTLPTTDMLGSLSEDSVLILKSSLYSGFI